MNSLVESVLDAYFRSHKELIEAEEVEKDTVVVSFPMYYSANHRIELAVIKLPSGGLHITDMARTLDELKLAGISISGQTRKRIVALAANANIRLVGDNMIRECAAEQLGDVLHLFADSAKTVGDAYLVHRARMEPEDELRNKVRRRLIEKNYPFREVLEIPGEIEKHEVDFFIPPNGRPALALSVLARPTRLLAEAWAFKSEDIKVTNRTLKIGLVYGVEFIKEEPKEIITRRIDVPVPSNDLDAMERAWQIDLVQPRRDLKLS